MRSKLIKIRLPLWMKIILGMVLGIIWGLFAVRMGLEEFTTNWIKPWGNIFIKMLKLIAVPLIFVSLVKGITSVTDMSKLGRIGFKTVGLYLITTIISVILGLLLVNAVKPGKSFSEEKRADFNSQYQNYIKEKEEVASDIKGGSPLYFF